MGFAEMPVLLFMVASAAAWLFVLFLLYRLVRAVEEAAGAHRGVAEALQRIADYRDRPVGLR